MQDSFRVRPFFVGTAVFALSAAATAQTEVLVATGDVLPGGLGIVVDVQDVAFNDAGDWVVTARTNLMPSTQTVLIKNGTVVLQPGDALPATPPFDVYQGARTLRIDEQGGFAWVSGHPGSVLSDGTAVYMDTTLVALDKTPIVAAGITPGTEYQGFYDVVLEPGGVVLAHSIMNDPNILGFQQNLLMRYVPQPGGGYSNTVLAKRGDFLPGVADPIQSFSEAPHGLASNSSGEVIYLPIFLNGTDGVYLDQTPLALKGELSPVFGRFWNRFTRVPVAINDNGDFAFAGYLSGDFSTDTLLVWNGIKLIQEGDTLPAIAPYTFTDLKVGQPLGAPIELADDGRVFWYGEWSDPDTSRNSGIFMDHDLLVREGDTFVDGSAIADFLAPSSLPPRPTFRLNSDGSALAFRAELADGRTGAFIVRPDGSAEVVQGCTPNAGLLEAFGPPSVGSSFLMKMENPQADGALALLFASTLGFPGSPCGLSVPAGEILIDIAPPNPFLGLAATSITPVLAFINFPPFPDDPSLFGFSMVTQGLWVDVAGLAPNEVFRLTNAVALALGQ